jgi:multiple sugar transport system substrate-binding protein
MTANKIFRTVSLVLVFALLMGVLSIAAAQDKVQVIWYVGVGTGTNTEQIAAQEQVVADFNAAHPDIELVLNINADNTTAVDVLQTLIASGNPPDIIGPVGTAGANSFAGSWYDIEPAAVAAGYDFSQFPEAAVNFYRTEEGLVGLPLAVFPTMIYFNRDLFDEADLAYPPQEFDAPYVDADGNELVWNYETLAELSKILTVDANGNDASMEEFDPENIVQFGFINQWANTRNEWSIFGAGTVYNTETGEAYFPEHWTEGVKWVYDGIWSSHFIPNATYSASELLQGGGGQFSSGNVAMARTHLWYTCCLGDAGINFDLAVVPAAADGTYTSNLHADTFRVLEHPGTEAKSAAVFAVVDYLTGEASLSLLNVYGGMPARPEDREAFFAGLDERYSQGVNWSVAEASLNYPDIPSHEGYLPNYIKAEDRMTAFKSLYESTAGLDIDAELATLVSDLQAIFDEVK